MIMSYEWTMALNRAKRWIPIFLLVLWSTGASWFAYRGQKNLVLIGIDENGTRIITASDDPLFKTELVNFIRNFVGLLYNFSADSFNTNVGTASDLMSSRLWESQKSQMVLLKKNVKSDQISQSTYLKTISKAKDGSYLAIVHTIEMRRLRRDEFDQELTFKIEKSTRSATNPWGMEMTEIKERRI